MSKYCIVVVPDYRFNFVVKFVRAVEWSPVNLRMEAWFTDHMDEVLTIEGENEARSLLHDLQLRYPLQDFIAIRYPLQDFRDIAMKGYGSNV